VFADYQNGLVELKLKQLLSSTLIDEIILSTNDEEILEYAESLGSRKIRIHKRLEALSSSATSTDDLVSHALQLIPDSHILWTHVTAPFINGYDYDIIISEYLRSLASGYDSLMTTTVIHSFLWNADGPINYDRNIEKWPRTQTLPAVHEVNSGVFLSHSRIYKMFGDRIGQKPIFHPLDKIRGFDIDWPDDFSLAECMVSAGLAKL